MVVSSVPLATFAKYKLSQWIPQVAIFKLLSVHPPRSYIWCPISPKPSRLWKSWRSNVPHLTTSEGKPWKRKRPDPQKKNQVLPEDSSGKGENQVHPEPPLHSSKQIGGEQNMSSTLDPVSDEGEGRVEMLQRRHNFAEVFESSSTLAKFGTGTEFITVDIHWIWWHF